MEQPNFSFFALPVLAATAAAAAGLLSAGGQPAAAGFFATNSVTTLPAASPSNLATASSAVGSFLAGAEAAAAAVSLSAWAASPIASMGWALGGGTNAAGITNEAEALRCSWTCIGCGTLGGEVSPNSEV